MKQPILLFVQGGGEGAYKEDQQLSLFLEDALKGDCIIRYPAMPDESNPDYRNYKIKIDEELKKINSKLVLVGHSVGSCFLLKYLSEEKPEKEIAGIFLVATPYWGEGGWQYPGFKLQDNFELELPQTPIFFYHATDDEIVPFSHLALYEKKLPGASFRAIDGGGHQLNNDLSRVVDDIRSLGI